MTTQTFSIGDNVTVKIDRGRGLVSDHQTDALPDGTDLVRVEYPSELEAWFDPRYLEMTDPAVLAMPWDADDRLAA